MAKQWVEFLKDFEDGYGKYQKGQVAELNDSARVSLYIEKHVVKACEPPKEKLAKKTKVTKEEKPL